MEDWVPPPEYVASVTSMLADACSGETVAQMRAYETMTASLSLPPFVLTLAYVVAADALPRGEGVDTAVRARMRQVGAGALKTALTQSAKLLDEATLEFIKGYLPLMLGDRSPALRRMGAHIISALARHQGLDHWGQLVPMLSSALGNVESLPGALLCLSQLCEDVAAEFVDAVEDSTLAGLFPQLIALMAHGDIDIRKLATDCMRELQVVQSSAFLSVRQQYLSALAALMEDPTARIKEAVSTSLSALLEHWLADIWSGIDTMIDFQLRCLHDVDVKVITASCDFWATFATHVGPYKSDSPEYPAVLLPHLDTLVRSLVACMRLTDDDLEGQQIEDVDERGIADREADVLPTTTSRLHHKAGNATGHEGTVVEEGESGGAGGDGGDDTDEEEEGEDLSLDPHARSATYTPRVAAGGALDLLAIVYPDEILNAAFPLASGLLAVAGEEEAAWKARECGLIVLGTLANGCTERLAGRLSDIIPYLFQTADDRRPPVRSTAIWTASKYCDWMVEMQVAGGEDGEEGYQYIGDFLAILAPRLNDRSKDVQLYALKALTDLCNTAMEAIEPYVGKIVEVCMQCLPHYQLKSRLSCYDVFASLAENGSDAFSDGELSRGLVAELFARAAALPDEAFELSALLGTLSAVIPVLPFLMAESTGQLFMRAAALLQAALTAEAAAVAAGSRGGGDARARIALCVDYCDSVVEAAKSGSAELLVSSGILPCLPTLLAHVSPSIRQSAFAMLGTVAQHCYELLDPAVDTIIPLIAASIRADSENRLVATNAVWAAGQIVMRAGGKLRPIVPLLLEKLAEVLDVRDLPRSIYENVGITLGSIGTGYPDLLSPGLSRIANKWIKCLVFVTGPEERFSGFVGLYAVVAHNPAGIAKGLCNFLKVTAHYIEDSPPPEMLACMSTALAAVRTHLTADQINGAVSGLSADEVASLRTIMT